MGNFRLPVLAWVVAVLLATAGEAAALQLVAQDFGLLKGQLLPPDDDPKVQYDSGQIAFMGGGKIVSPANNQLLVSLAFFNARGEHEKLKLTDAGSDVLIEEQVLSVTFRGPGQPGLTEPLELDADIEVVLSGPAGSIKVRPGGGGDNVFTDGAVCLVSATSTECSNLGLGFDDFTDGMASFRDIHLQLTINSFVDPNANMGAGGGVANVALDSVQFKVSGDLVEIVPWPAAVSLMVVGGLGLGAVSARGGARRAGRRSPSSSP
jgi:hypothetical protein